MSKMWVKGVEEMKEERLERIVMERKIEANFDGVHATRQTVFVNSYKLCDGLNVSKENGYLFVHPNEGSLDAEVIEKNGKKILIITRNDKRAID